MVFRTRQNSELKEITRETLKEILRELMGVSEFIDTLLSSNNFTDRKP